MISEFVNQIPNKLDIGYWKNGKLIRLRRSVIKDGMFDFNQTFSNYDFYNLIDLDLMKTDLNKDMHNQTCFNLNQPNQFKDIQIDEFCISKHKDFIKLFENVSFIKQNKIMF